jgi:hypothetical protein
MQARTWWIDEPLVMAASNPMGEDQRLRPSSGLSQLEGLQAAKVVTVS